MKKPLILLLLCIAVFTCYRFGSTIIKSVDTQIGLSEIPGQVRAKGPQSSAEDRIAYMHQRYRNPVTDEFPQKMRSREMAFAGQLPVKKTSNTSRIWQARGPHNVGGRTRAIQFDAENEATLLIGGVSSGMWKSDNSGTSYRKTTTSLQLQGATCLAQDRRPGKTNIWYYGTGETRGGEFVSGDGIYKSFDNGETWELLPATSSNTPTTFTSNGDFDLVAEIVTDHTEMGNDVVLAAVFNGIARSQDGGASWEPVLGMDTSRGSTSRYSDLDITENGIYYATLSSEGPFPGIFRSEDGITWTDITPNAFPNRFNRIEIGIAPSDENQVYFVLETPGSGATGHQLWHYNYLSGDGSGNGGDWVNLTANLPNEDCLGFYTFNFGPYDTQGSYDMCIAVKPDDADVVFLGGTNIYRSTTGWRTPDYEWVGGYQCDTAEPSNYVWPNHHPDQHQMRFLPSDPNVMYSANDGGVYKTDDCTASPIIWESLNNGFASTQLYALAFEPGEVHNDILVVGMQDNGTHMTNTSIVDANWKHVFYGDGAFAAITHGRDNYYISWQTGKTFKFVIDDDGNVNGLTRIDPDRATGHMFINPFILDPSDDNRMYFAGGRFIWRNDSLDAIPIIGDEYNAIDQGWMRIDDSRTGGGALAPRVSTLDMAAANPDVLYYGTTSGTLFKLDDVRGADPVQTDLTSPLFPGGNLSCVEVDRETPTDILVSFSNYEVPSIFYSTDGGTTFTDVSGNLEENPDGSGNGPAVNWVHSFHSGDSSIYFAGTSVGLYSTQDLDGANTEWSREGDESIGLSQVYMIESRAFDGMIAVATYGNGAFSHKMFPPVGINDNLSLSGLHLEQNQPNPFSGGTKFNFSQIEPGQVQLEITDLSGRRVAMIDAGFRSAGKHSIKWDGRTEIGELLPSGNYIYRMIAGDQSISRKLVIAR